MSRSKSSVIKTLRHELPRNSSLLVACSGGIDSIALLHGCAALQRELSLKIEVAHLDHGLRKESVKDAHFVRKICKQLKFPFHLKRVKPSIKSGNIEDWGRKQRYIFFTALVKKRKLSLILTAHNANDVAETFLMRLVSNKELNSIIKYDPDRKLLRPLLAVPRSAIEEYVSSKELEHIEDLTNQNTTFLRNRIRHKLLPLLRQEFDRRIVETVAERATALADDYVALNSAISAHLKLLAAHKFGSKSWLQLLISILKDLHPALRSRLSLAILNSYGIYLGRDHGERFAEFILSRRLGLELPGGIRFQARNGGIMAKGLKSLKK